MNFVLFQHLTLSDHLLQVSSTYTAPPGQVFELQYISLQAAISQLLSLNDQLLSKDNRSFGQHKSKPCRNGSRL